MALTLSRMRALTRKGLGGLDDHDLPDEEVDELLNMSLWELESRFDFKEKECLISIPITAGISEYKLPSITDALITAALVDLTRDRNRIKLIKSSFDNEHEKPDGMRDVDVQGTPMYYHRRNWIVVLTPTPKHSNRWELEIVMWRTVRSLVEGSVETPGLPRNWHELVVEGGIVRGHFYNEDYNIAQQASNFQVGKVRAAVSTNTKEDRDNRYAGVKVLWEDPNERFPRS